MKGKELKGEKYIYFAMAYQLAKQQPETTEHGSRSILIGDDNGMIGGQNYYRRFSIMKYQDEILLIEKKTSKHFASFVRAFSIIESGTQISRIHIYEYINEKGENGSKRWEH